MNIIQPEGSLPYNKDLKKQARELRKDMTPHERILWYNFLKGRKPRFLRQKIIMNYMVDFYCAKAKLVIELDGESHILEGQDILDKNRTKILESYGIKVIRFTNLEIEINFEKVCEKIEFEVKNRATL